MFSFDINKCWEWNKAKRVGYGVYNNRLIHRVIAEFFYETKLNKKMFVCHKCNNRLCFNPSHLYIGDAKTNAQDRVKCGQQSITNEKTRQTLLGKKHTDERRKNQSLAQKKLYENGYINPRKGKEGKLNSGSFAKGKDAPNKGRKMVIIDGKIRYIK